MSRFKDKKYKIYLAYSTDMEVIGEISNASNKKLDLSLNKPGSFSFDVPFKDDPEPGDMVNDIYDGEIVKCVKVYRENPDSEYVCVWSGYINDITTDWVEEKISVNCVGWAELLFKREWHTDAQFTDIDAGEIVSRCLNEIHGQTYLVNLVNNFSFESIFSDFTVSAGTISENVDWSTSGAKSVIVDHSGVVELESAFIESDGISDLYGTASVDLKCLEFDSGVASTVDIEVVLYDSSQVYVGEISESYAAGPGTDLDVGDVKTISVSGVVGPTATYPYFKVLVRFNGSFDKQFAVDNIQVVDGQDNLKRPFFPIVMGSVDVSLPRTVKFDKRSKIGDAIEKLSTVEAGFDFSVDPETRELDVHYGNVAGTINGLGENKEGLIFAYNFGPRNIRSLRTPSNASDLVNKTNAVGQYSVGTAFDEGSIEAYGLFESTVSLSDVTDVDVLVGYAGAETAYKLQPFQTYEFEPLNDAADSTFSPFDDFSLGDIGYLCAQKGDIVIDFQPVRLFGFSIDIDENGNERVSNVRTVAS